MISNLDEAMLRKANIHAAALREANPRLICVHVTGFGAGGPAGTDGLAQAAMGMMALTGSVPGPGFRTGPSVLNELVVARRNVGRVADVQDVRD